MHLIQKLSQEEFNLLELIQGLVWISAASLLEDKKSIEALENWKQYLLELTDEERATLLLQYSKDLAQECINKSYKNCLLHQ